jgi:FSR family fosmidomycin resistance protein-like MFS transporter
MSLYMAGGELGRTVGPLLVAWAISTWTLEGIWRLAALGWITSAILYWRFRNITAQAAPKNRKRIRTVFPALRRLFIPLSAMMFFRSFLIAAMSVFVPTLMESLGYTPEESALALAIWFFAGIGGALMGGTVSDRLGRKPLLILAVGGGGLMMVGFLGALNIGGIVLIPVLLVSGFISLSGTSVVHALVLEQNPEYRATASGIFMLLAFLSRSIATLLIGGMGDWIGLETAFLVTAVLSLCAIPLIVILPDLKQKTEG